MRIAIITMNDLRTYPIAIFILLLFLSILTVGQDKSKFLNLKGEWKFTIGDNKNWSKADYNDSDWETVTVPSPWEDEGFHGYDGYAWYRKKFYIPQSLSGSDFRLHLGYIDDADEVYVNGKLIGRTGSFPPYYETAYDKFRKYILPLSILNFGKENIIAIKVYDAELGGGITGGETGIYAFYPLPVPDMDLSGEWEFKTGNDKSEKYNKEEWRKILVPGYWENQGFADYNGIAWYRRSFTLSPALKGKALVMMFGKIDDIDEVYLNGTLIGSTGRIKGENGNNSELKEYYKLFRGYYIPDGLIKENGENVIEVRVYDGFIDGGIYGSPVGLIEQEKYSKFWREKKKSFW